ncbi:MAG: potassium transporter [Pseudarthrobacter sp.]|nr:potassium transporter [Pseudarthrobacter sp.]
MTTPQQPEKPSDPAQEPPTMAVLAEGYAAKAGLHRRHDGRIDVLRTAGGVQGIAESIVPGLVFLISFTITRDLTPSLIAALASAAVFTVVRLVQRRPLTQALAGVVGVGISAWLANTTGKAEDFYLPGFITNAAYILAMVVSIAVKWPVAGLLFGFIRNEGVHWRQDPARLRAYRLGTWIIVAVLVLRLVVQVPLYLLGGDGLAALATTRLLMGAPLYILGVWVAWLVTRPVPADAGTQPSKPSSSAA